MAVVAFLVSTWTASPANPASATNATGAQMVDASPGVSFVHEGVVNAAVSDVWKIWSTAEGYKRLGPQLVDIDLRIGGVIRSKYEKTGTLDDDNTIVNRIMAFEPERMMAIRIDRTPAGFPFKEAWKQTWTVITMTPVNARQTHLRIASLGFGNDAESVKMRQFFEAGNAATLKLLQESFGK